MRARLGFVYDPTPSPSNTLTPDLPDATRIKVAAGVGWHHQSGFKIDFGFQFVALMNQHSGATGFPGTYGGTAEVMSLTLGYNGLSRIFGGEGPGAVLLLPAGPVQRDGVAKEI